MSLFDSARCDETIRTVIGNSSNNASADDSIAEDINASRKKTIPLKNRKCALKTQADTPLSV